MECKCEQIAQRITLVPSTIIKMNMRMAEMLLNLSLPTKSFRCHFEIANNTKLKI